MRAKTRPVSFAGATDKQTDQNNKIKRGRGRNRHKASGQSLAGGPDQNNADTKAVVNTTICVVLIAYDISITRIIALHIWLSQLGIYEVRNK